MTELSAAIAAMSTKMKTDETNYDSNLEIMQASFLSKGNTDYERIKQLEKELSASNANTTQASPAPINPPAVSSDRTANDLDQTPVENQPDNIT